MQPSDAERLLERAREARERAYAPFSQFKVGAAIQLADGRIFTGCNVECSSYGLTLCAERTAIACAVVQGGGRSGRGGHHCRHGASMSSLWSVSSVDSGVGAAGAGGDVQSER